MIGEVMPTERTPLTKSRIEKAKVPPGTGQIMLWDTIVSGFGVRCLPGGSKTFVFRYRPHGGGRSVNPRLLKLGAFPSISLDDARGAARIQAGNVAKGKDPAQQRAEERRRNRATLAKLLAEDGPYELHLKELRDIVPLVPRVPHGKFASRSRALTVPATGGSVATLYRTKREGRVPGWDLGR
jgi:hypothetical protein